jgi:hypothetical protein
MTLLAVSTAAWVFIVVLLPLIGTLAYFLLRKPTEEEIRQSQAATAEQRGSRPG